MNLLTEFFQLSVDCVKQFKDTSPGKFALTLAAAAVLSSAAWVVCSKWTYLWNKGFHAEPIHHLLCAVSAVLTGLLVVLYPSLSHLEAVARKHIDNWALVLQMARGEQVSLPPEDSRVARAWSTETFLTARHELFQLEKKEAGGKSFSPDAWRGVYYLLPNDDAVDARNPATLERLAKENGWTLDADEKHIGAYRDDRPVVPLDAQGSGPRSEKAAEVYADRAILLFQERHPLLSWIIWPPRAKISKEMIQENIGSWFTRNPNLIYPLSDATDIARRQVEIELQRQAPRVVTVGRWSLSGLFILAQGFPFTLIGWAAYRNLKAHRRPVVTRSRRVTA